MDFKVIVNCGGKCGSSSLLRTFEKRNMKGLQVHNNERLMLEFNDVATEAKTDNVRDLIFKQLATRLIVIDVYRTPIERLVSSMFQHIESIQNYHEKDMKIFSYLLSANISSESYHPFDDNFSDLFPGNCHGKYRVEHEGGITFIKLKFKYISEWSKQLSDILETDIEVIEDNISSSKKYYSVYEQFKKEFFMKRSDFEFLMSNETVKKYMTESEIESYREKWEHRVISDEEFSERLKTISFVNVPNDFNTSYYRKAFSDLSNIENDLDLKIHYEMYGFYEKRSYSVLELTTSNNFCAYYGYGSNMRDVTKIIRDNRTGNTFNLSGSYNEVFGDNCPGLLKCLTIISNSIISIPENTNISLKIE